MVDMRNLGALHARAINSNNIVLSEEDGLPRLVNLAWVQEHQCSSLNEDSLVMYSPEPNSDQVGCMAIYEACEAVEYFMPGGSSALSE